MGAQISWKKGKNKQEKTLKADSVVVNPNGIYEGFNGTLRLNKL